MESLLYRVDRRCVDFVQNVTSCPCDRGVRAICCDRRGPFCHKNPDHRLLSCRSMGLAHDRVGNRRVRPSMFQGEQILADKSIPRGRLRRFVSLQRALTEQTQRSQMVRSSHACRSRLIQESSASVILLPIRRSLRPRSPDYHTTCSSVEGGRTSANKPSLRWNEEQTAMWKGLRAAF